MSEGIWIASYEGGSFTSNCTTHQSIIYVLGIRKDFDPDWNYFNSLEHYDTGQHKCAQHKCFLLCLWLIVVFPPLWGNTQEEMN